MDKILILIVLCLGLGSAIRIKVKLTNSEDPENPVECELDDQGLSTPPDRPPIQCFQLVDANGKCVTILDNPSGRVNRTPCNRGQANQRFCLRPDNINSPDVSIVGNNGRCLGKQDEEGDCNGGRGQKFRISAAP